MLTNIKSLFFGAGNGSNRTAKNRLQMVLVQDRSGLSSTQMESFREDLLNVITRYFVLERKNLDIEWDRSNGSTAMVINTPVLARRAEKEAQKGAAEPATVNAS